jgi:hypothetical protein
MRGKRRWEKQAQADRAMVAANLEMDQAKEEKKSKRAAVLDSLNCVFDVSALDNLNVKQMDLQLAWHRRLDSKVPMCKMLPRRPEKLKALADAVERHNLGEASVVDGTIGVALNLSNAKEVQDVDVDLADDDWDMEKE